MKSFVVILSLAALTAADSKFSRSFQPLSGLSSYLDSREVAEYTANPYLYKNLWSYPYENQHDVKYLISRNEPNVYYGSQVDYNGQDDAVQPLGNAHSYGQLIGKGLDAGSDYLWPYSPEYFGRKVSSYGKYTQGYRPLAGYQGLGLENAKPFTNAGSTRGFWGRKLSEGVLPINPNLDWARKSQLDSVYLREPIVSRNLDSPKMSMLTNDFDGQVGQYVPIQESSYTTEHLGRNLDIDYANSLTSGKLTNMDYFGSYLGRNLKSKNFNIEPFYEPYSPAHLGKKFTHAYPDVSEIQGKSLARDAMPLINMEKLWNMGYFRTIPDGNNMQTESKNLAGPAVFPRTFGSRPAKPTIVIRDDNIELVEQFTPKNHAVSRTNPLEVFGIIDSWDQQSVIPNPISTYGQKRYADHLSSRHWRTLEELPQVHQWNGDLHKAVQVNAGNPLTDKNVHIQHADIPLERTLLDNINEPLKHKKINWTPLELTKDDLKPVISSRAINYIPLNSAVFEKLESTMPVPKYYY